DLSVLTYLAAAQHVGTVVLNSSAMPPVNADAVFRPDDAVASVKVAGLPMNVLLSDNTLTGILRAGNTSSGTLPANTEFAVRQRFLAETAMIAAEAPDSKPTASYTRSLDEALLATESAAWRGRRAAQGAALADHLSEYIKNADNKVRFISSGQVPMGGASGLVPVSIQNGLHQAIRVRVVA